MGRSMEEIEWAELRTDAEGKDRQRTTWSEISVETNDGFLIGLDTDTWIIVYKKNNDVMAHNKLDTIFDTILIVTVEFIN